MGDDHVSSSAKNPVREDAFEMSEEEKIKLIEKDKDWELLEKFDNKLTSEKEPKSDKR